MAGPSHHYLPAGFLGRFSSKNSGSLRERSLWALEIGQDKPTQTTANKIGYEDNLYRLYGTQNQAPDTVDKVWERYEQRLSPALDELVSSKTTISANTWLRVLVPFVTGLFVRGKEFGPRYEERLSAMGMGGAKPFGDPEWQSDNTNASRLIEFQRLMAPVMAARWVVLHTASNTPVITNELGFTLFQPPDGSGMSIAIPIGPKTILGLIPTWPSQNRVIMQDGGTGQWRTLIERHTLKAGDQENFNEALANISHEFLAGPTAESVEPHKVALNDKARLQPGFVEALWPKHRLLVAHELEWHRAVTAISRKSSDLIQPDLQNIDWSVVARDWAPAVILATNLKDFPSGMLLQGNRISFSMTEVPGFTDGTKNSPYILSGRPTKDKQ